jgi:hypothetical protein
MVVAWWNVVSTTTARDFQIGWTTVRDTRQSERLGAMPWPRLNGEPVLPKPTPVIQTR